MGESSGARRPGAIARARRGAIAKRLVE